MQNKYGGTCRCSSYVPPGAGAYVSGAVMCATCAPAGSTVPAQAVEQLPDGVEPVRLQLSGSVTACDAVVEKLRLNPGIEVRRVAKQPADEDGQVVVEVQATIYAGRGW